MVYEGAIPSMLRQLDPHTQFFDPAQFQQLKQMQESEQKGFGSVVSVLPGQVIFLQTLPGTPSNKAGIQAGDELIAINNYAIRRLDPAANRGTADGSAPAKNHRLYPAPRFFAAVSVHSDAGTGGRAQCRPDVLS